MHCYWKVPYFTDVAQLEGINRRLMFYLEADASGYDATQVLRPPLSKNWKHNGVPVTLKTLEEHPLPKLLSIFDVAPIVEREVIRLNATMLLDPGELLKALPLHVHTKKRIMSETTDFGSRSSFLTKTAHEMAEQGCNHLQIVTLLSYMDDRVGKFKGRRDKLTRLSELASLALLAHQVEEGWTLYSPLDIINHKETLDWIIPGWLHTKGFMILTGPPAAGKTSLAIEMGYHLLTQPESLGRDVSSNELKILLLSLEMSSVELQYIFQHLNKKFANNEKWDVGFRVLDEEKTLLEYEEIIAEYEPDIVFLDSLTELASEELKESEARAITRWIKKCRRKYNTAWVCIHHNRKDTSRKKFKETQLGDVYGSYIFGKDSDTVLNLERDVDDDTLIALYNLKGRYDRKFMVDLEQDPESLYFSVKGTLPFDSERPDTIKPGTIDLGL
jgi:archaellum biogenesis ATPase FlaH